MEMTEQRKRKAEEEIESPDLDVKRPPEPLVEEQQAPAPALQEEAPTVQIELENVNTMITQRAIVLYANYLRDSSSSHMLMNSHMHQGNAIKLTTPTKLLWNLVENHEALNGSMMMMPSSSIIFAQPEPIKDESNMDLLLVFFICMAADIFQGRNMRDSEEPKTTLAILTRDEIESFVQKLDSKNNHNQFVWTIFQSALKALPQDIKENKNALVNFFFDQGIECSFLYQSELDYATKVTPSYGVNYRPLPVHSRIDLVLNFS
jgi:hypothetical protein